MWCAADNRNYMCHIRAKLILRLELCTMEIEAQKAADGAKFAGRPVETRRFANKFGSWCEYAEK